MKKLQYTICTYESAKGLLTEQVKCSTRKERREWIGIIKNRLKADKVSASVVTYVNGKFHSSF